MTDTVGLSEIYPKIWSQHSKPRYKSYKKADVLVHVIDAHAQNPEQHITAVEHILTELGLQDIPCLRFFNKGILLTWKTCSVCVAGMKGLVVRALEEASLQVIQQEIGHLLFTHQSHNPQIRETGTMAMIDMLHSADGIG